MIRSVYLLSFAVGACLAVAPVYADADLNATVNYQDSEAFVVTNNSAFAWTDCIVKLNPHGFSDGYVMHLDLVKPGETVNLGLADFVLDDGTRFDSSTHEVLAFYINCETPKGTQSYMLTKAGQ